MAKKRVATGLLRALDQHSDIVLEELARGGADTGADYFAEEDTTIAVSEPIRSCPQGRSGELYGEIWAGFRERFKTLLRYPSPDHGALRTLRCFLPFCVPATSEELSASLKQVKANITWLKEVSSKTSIVNVRIHGLLKVFSSSLEAQFPSKQELSGLEYWELLAAVAISKVVPPIEDKFDLDLYISDYERRFRGAEFLARKGQITVKEITDTLADMSGPDLAAVIDYLFESDSEEIDLGKEALTRGEIVTTQQAAEELEVTDSRVKQFAQEGRIGTKLGRAFLFSLKELDLFDTVERPSGRQKEE